MTDVCNLLKREKVSAERKGNRETARLIEDAREELSCGCGTVCTGITKLSEGICKTAVPFPLSITCGAINTKTATKIRNRINS